MAGTRNSPLVRALLVLALTACALIAPASAPAATGGAKPPGSRDACPALPGTLAGGTGQFTMMIRINQMDNVDTFTNFNSATGGLGGRVRAQDIFVINSRFAQTTPAVAETLAQKLRQYFPCNRIITLNGLNSDPSAPGYLLTLAGSAVGIFGVLLDYEPMDWEEARAQNPALPPFTYNPRKNLRRFGGFASAVSNTLAATPNAFARTGIAPIDNGYWNYGQFAQTADAYNQRLGARHLGIQSVQTQNSCQTGSGAFSSRLAALYGQYKYRIKIKKKKVRKKGKIRKRKIRKRVKIKKAAQANRLNLATQISFSNTPEPGDPLPIKAVSAAQADNCVAAGLARGQGAFFFFASDSSMKLLYQQPTVGSLRPATS